MEWGHVAIVQRGMECGQNGCGVWSCDLPSRGGCPGDGATCEDGDLGEGALHLESLPTS